MLIAALIRNVPADEQIQLSLIVLWAMLLGGAIGIERERAAKASGIRTHMLVAGAAAIVTAISAGLTGAVGVAGDPSRGIHGVITGIGFLGAGAIIQSRKGAVTGLTTAASIFYTAAVGCGVAVGYGVTATIGTGLGIGVLYVVGHVSHTLPISPKLRDTQQNHEDNQKD